MFESNKMFSRLGYTCVEGTGFSIFKKVDGKEEYRIHFDDVNCQYKQYMFINGHRFFNEWVDLPLFKAIAKYIEERQWK